MIEDLVFPDEKNKKILIVTYRILLDNFDFKTTKKAVDFIGNKCLTESSGNIN